MTLLRPLVEAIARRLPPPRVIYDRLGKTPYLSRYYVLGGARTPDGSAPFDATGHPKKSTVFRDGINIFLHRFHRGDDDTALHNHPWRWAVSLVLVGGYSEERRRGNDVDRREVRPLSLNIIRANDFHRVDLLEHDCWSLFVAGPRAG